MPSRTHPFERFHLPNPLSVASAHIPLENRKLTIDTRQFQIANGECAGEVTLRSASSRLIPVLPKVSPRAFTLFEALVALAIFSFAVMGFLMAFDSALGAAREVRREAVIRQILEDRIAWLEEAELRKMEVRSEGPLPGMTVFESIEPEQLTDTDLTIYDGFWRCRVVLEWQRDGQPETLEAGFLRYGQ